MRVGVALAAALFTRRIRLEVSRTVGEVFGAVTGVTLEGFVHLETDTELLFWDSCFWNERGDRASN